MIINIHSINEAPVKEVVNPSEYKNSPQYRNRSFSELELADEAITSTIVSLIDLAGHEKVKILYKILF